MNWRVTVEWAIYSLKCFNFKVCYKRGPCYKLVNIVFLKNFCGRKMTLPKWVTLDLRFIDLDSVVPFFFSFVSNPARRE